MLRRHGKDRKRKDRGSIQKDMPPAVMEEVEEEVEEASQEETLQNEMPPPVTSTMQQPTSASIQPPAAPVPQPAPAFKQFTPIILVQRPISIVPPPTVPVLQPTSTTTPYANSTSYILPPPTYRPMQSQGQTPKLINPAIPVPWPISPFPPPTVPVLQPTSTTTPYANSTSYILPPPTYRPMQSQTSKLIIPVETNYFMRTKRIFSSQGRGSHNKQEITCALMHSFVSEFISDLQAKNMPEQQKLFFLTLCQKVWAKKMQYEIAKEFWPNHAEGKSNNNIKRVCQRKMNDFCYGLQFSSLKRLDVRAVIEKIFFKDGVIIPTDRLVKPTLSQIEEIMPSFPTFLQRQHEKTNTNEKTNTKKRTFESDDSDSEETATSNKKRKINPEDSKEGGEEDEEVIVAEVLDDDADMPSQPSTQTSSPFREPALTLFKPREFNFKEDFEKFLSDCMKNKANFFPAFTNFPNKEYGLSHQDYTAKLKEKGLWVKLIKDDDNTYRVQLINLVRNETILQFEIARQNAEWQVSKPLPNTKNIL